MTLQELKEHNDRMDALWERYFTHPAWEVWLVVAGIMIPTIAGIVIILAFK